MLQYYDHTQPIVIQTDASTAGLGAVLIQQNKPVAYASRSLTDAETRYAPLELECLAIVFAARKFDQYIFGHANVTIQTDHKPLVSIFNRSLLTAPRRLQSMLLVLQRYSFSIEWRPGTEQVTADMLSRNPIADISHEIGTETVFILIEKASLMKDPPLRDPVLERVRVATQADPEMQKLREHIVADWEKCDSEMEPYLSFRSELTIDDGLIVKGSRLVIPRALRKEMLTLLHTSHQGLAATLRRARRTIFWPGITQELQKVVDSCEVCQRNSPDNRRDELLSHAVPSQPWMKVGVDLFSFGGKDYIVIVDYHSDYFEFEMLPDASAHSVVLFMKNVFARLGVPSVVQSDNGTQFTFWHFSKFSEKWCFSHTTSAPHHPCSNGKAESAVKLAKKILKRADDPYLGLLEFRNTPTAGMTSSPIERLMGRPTRTPLPNIIPRSEENERNREEKEHRRKQVAHSFNRNTVPLRPLKEGEPVLLKTLMHIVHSGRMQGSLNSYRLAHILSNVIMNCFVEIDMH